MGKLGKYLENFAFKSFDFRGRATRTEFWFCMTIVWAILLVVLYTDLLMVWDMLLQRKVPPLNPLAYGSVILILITTPARLSLIIRRLHDSGKSGLWVKLPYVSVWSGLVMSLGVASAFMSVGMNSGNGLAQGMLMGVVGLAMAAGSGNFWDIIFSIAASLNSVGWDGVMGMISGTGGSGLQTSGSFDTVGSVRSASPEEQYMKVVGIFMLATPLITGMLHLVFMLLPSNRGDNAYGQPEVLEQTGGLLLKSSDNPLAAYGHLYEKSEEQVQADRERAKEEIKSLYQQRVLGKNG